MKRRMIFILLLLLLGGAILNIAVAWGCALMHPPLRDSAGTLARELAADFFGYPEWREPIDSIGTGYRRQRVQLGRDEMYTDQTWHAAVRVEAGWPVLAFRGVYRGRYRSPDSPHSHGEHAMVVHSGDGRPYVLPLRPNWFGFLFNTYLYAAHLGLLLAIPLLFRCGRRFRGRCEKCAYPIGASPVCTECGAAFVRKVQH